MRIIIAAAALLALAACGDADMEKAKQGVLDFGHGALEAATQAVDTRTICTVAGQSDAYCGCLQEHIGATLSPENVEAITTIVRQTMEGGSVQAAVEGASNIDAETRDALLQCATQPSGAPATNDI
jgi:formylmethanofuran:tetrahydromethanopterin formyltransferase